MSGGSFDYLCYKDAEQLFRCGQLEEMVTELTDMGYIDAAKETFALKTLIEQTKVRMEVYLDRLRPVWKAVEWYCSGDSGMDAVEEAIKKYRGE